jgi:hypothetical protein
VRLHHAYPTRLQTATCTTGCCLIPGPNSTCCWSAARSPSPELAYYICHCSGPVPVAELVRVAGSRSRVEETFQFAKNEPGLDHHPVRRYPAWYRHITLSMLAAAFLAVTAHTERGDQKGGTPATGPRRDQLVPLSCSEIRRLWAKLTQPHHPQAHTDHWSDWRRLHQTRAQRSHYQRQRLKHHSLRLPYEESPAVRLGAIGRGRR